MTGTYRLDKQRTQRKTMPMNSCWKRKVDTDRDDTATGYRKSYLINLLFMFGENGNKKVKRFRSLPFFRLMFFIFRRTE